MRKFLPIAIALLISTTAFADFKQGDKTLTLSGSGTNDRDFKNAVGSVNIGLSYFATDNVEVGLRSTVGYADTWSGNTNLAVDWNFNQLFNKNFVPFVGANVGYAYGGNVDNRAEAGPELGVRYFINDAAFVELRVEYEFDISGANSGNSFSRGLFNYSLGIGFKF